MPPLPSVIVVARDTALKQSLAFALEADGYRVDTFSSWPQAQHVVSEAVCVVVDHDIVQTCAAAKQAFYDPSSRIVLLAGHLTLPCPSGVQVLTKPLTGDDVIAAVNRFRSGLAEEPARKAEGAA